MLTPLVGLILGIATLLYAVLTYTGTPVGRPIPIFQKQKGNLTWAIGCVLVAVALMLGIIGYLNYANAIFLRRWRIIIGTVGLLLLGYQIGKIWLGNYSVKKLIKKLMLPLTGRWWPKFELLRTLVQRDLEARYKGSILGNLWPLLNQLSQLLILTYVFAVVLKVKLSLQGLPANNATFGLWLFAGLLPWNAFSGGFLQAAGAVVFQPNLVKKVVFPLALLPLVPICSAFIESSFGLMVLILLVGVMTHTIHSTLWLLPLVWLPQLLLTAGLGYLVAAFTVFLRDVPQTLGVLLNLWFYATPLIYPAHMIPEAWRVWVFWLNPMAAIAEVYRELILVGEVQHWGEWGAASLISLILFYIGLTVYQRLRPAFADVL
jgi:lipopolysaccharide transport system permease protein